MDIKDMMNALGVDVFTVDENGVQQYKPEENALHNDRCPACGVSVCLGECGLPVND